MRHLLRPYQHTFFTPICSFIHMAESGWQEAAWNSKRLHAIYDLAHSTQSGPDLQMIWSAVCVWVQTFTECAARCQAMLCEVTTPHWRRLRAGLVRKKGLCLLLPLQRIRDTDSVVNYESNHSPSCFPREGVHWLNGPWQVASLLFYCLVWVNQAGQRWIVPVKI